MLLEKVTVPETVTSIGSYAFYGAKNLSMLNSEVAGEFNIPQEVKVISSSVLSSNW